MSSNEQTTGKAETGASSDDTSAFVAGSEFRPLKEALEILMAREFVSPCRDQRRVALLESIAVRLNAEQKSEALAVRQLQQRIEVVEHVIGKAERTLSGCARVVPTDGSVMSIDVTELAVVLESLRGARRKHQDVVANTATAAPAVA
jgi:endonuclease III